MHHVLEYELPVEMLQFLDEMKSRKTTRRSGLAVQEVCCRGVVNRC